LEEALDRDEPAVIITRWPCVLKPMTEDEKRDYAPYAKYFKVDAEACNSCGLCLYIGCPSISKDVVSGKARIDSLTCVGCSVCEQICNFGVIASAEGAR